MKMYAYILKNYKIDIDYSKMEFVGNEINIRHFLFNFYWNSYKGIEWPFKHVNKTELLEVVKKSEDILNISNSYIEIERYCYFIAVSRSRVAFHYYCKNLKGLYYFIPKSKHGDLRAIAKSVLNSGFLPEDVLNQEINYLEIFVNLYSRSYEDSETKSDIIMNNMLINTMAYQAAKAVLAELKKRMSLDFSKNPDFLVSLLKTHYFSFLLQEGATVYKQDDLLAHYNGKYPTYCHLMQECIDHLASNPNLKKMYKEKKFIFLNYTFLLERYYNLYVFEKEIKIRVLLSEGVSLERVLSREIEKKIDGNIKILKESYKTENADIIISDFNISVDPKATLFIINYPLVEGDWIRLSELIRQLSSV